MRYVIIGAGAVGGMLGARLYQHSRDRPPLLIARGENGAAIARDGIRMRTADEDSTLRVNVADGPESVRLLHDDILVLTTKTQQAQAALDQWVGQPVFDDTGARIGIAGTCLPILTALNGVESERMALRLFARVYAVCVWLPATQLTPGEVILRTGPASGTFIIGSYERPADAADRALLATVSADWTASTFSIKVVDDVMRWKYTKLLSNLANGVEALVGLDEDISEIVDRLQAEAEDIYRASGITWASAVEEAVWRAEGFQPRSVPGVEVELGGSSWQSIARGSGSIESDYLNGEIVLMARKLGRSAPLNETIQRLAREAATARAGVAWMTLSELESLLAP
jgi:2-dehydropantoate 2-reductase